MILDDFLFRAALAAVGVALAAAPIGCFLVWRRMAYFSDATAHAAVLGVALALAFSISIFAGVLATSVLMALAVAAINRHGQGIDTVLGVFSHAALAFGLVAVSFVAGVRIDLMNYLFGDILAVNRTDLVVIWAGGLLVLALIAWRWRALLASTLSNDLAHAEGINPAREQMVLMVTLALVVAVGIKVVGALLIAAMMIIPAAAARPFARTPEAMVVLAALGGMTAALVGLWCSFLWDTQTGPTIVSTAAVLFAISHLLAIVRGGN